MAKSSKAKEDVKIPAVLDVRDVVIAVLIVVCAWLGYIAYGSSPATTGVSPQQSWKAQSAPEDYGGWTYGQEGTRIRTELPQGSYGSVYSTEFMNLVRPLYDSHMGTENMAPLLYSLVRFTKPQHILEIGAGYTSIFLLEALKDNAEEMSRFADLQEADVCHIPLNEKKNVEQCVKEEISKRNKGTGFLHTVDDLSHPGQTANKVQDIAKQLGSDVHLQLHVKDAWNFATEMDEDVVLDLIWLDFGAGERLDEFLDKWWPRLNPDGGLLAIHSSLTNAATRKWAVPYQGCYESEEKDKLGGKNNFAMWGLLEPHKRYQNSFTVIQKRVGSDGEGYSEPLYSHHP